MPEAGGIGEQPALYLSVMAVMDDEFTATSRVNEAWANNKSQDKTVSLFDALKSKEQDTSFGGSVSGNVTR